MTKQQVRGSLENMKGRVKQAAGAITGDKSLEAEGAYERAKGSAKEAVGKAKEKVEKAVDEEEAETSEDEE
jgi:uncharacterized protein YjbJ (UPF0337 family)